MIFSKTVSFKNLPKSSAFSCLQSNSTFFSISRGKFCRIFTNYGESRSLSWYKRAMQGRTIVKFSPIVKQILTKNEMRRQNWVSESIRVSEFTTSFWLYKRKTKNSKHPTRYLICVYASLYDSCYFLVIMSTPISISYRLIVILDRRFKIMFAGI